MGRSFTPKYRIEMQDSTPAAWHVKEYGKPNNQNLEKYILKYINSLKPNGCNYHISQSLGYIPIPNWAKIYTNDNSKILIAEWHAPQNTVSKCKTQPPPPAPAGK